MNRLESHRLFYANLVTAHAGVPPGSRIAAAFASTPRERFVCKPPWRVFTPVGYVPVPTNDPSMLYQDTTVALSDDGPFNNGQPSLHALCLAALDIREGDMIVHVGAGTGYYTTIIAKLTGPSGSVIAYETDRDLAERAARNLAEFLYVKLENRSGAEPPIPACDVLYVSAGATAPLDVWLDALRPGGRLLFPLTADDGHGAMLLITRKPEGGYSARFLCPVAFVPCVGARDKQTAQMLSTALTQRNMREVHSLHRDNSPDSTSWCAGRGWWLSTSS